MLKNAFIASMLAGISAASAFGATIDGKLISIDAENRTITMETGEMWNLTEYVVLDGLTPGQVVRITYTEETIDATAVDILEYPAVEPVVDSAEE